MRTKGPPPADSFPATVSPALGAALQLGQLKQLYRQGWLHRGLPPQKCESVAEHSFGTALLGLLLLDQLPREIDPLRLLQLALIHDAGEVHAGDLTPADGVSAEEKLALERQSVQRIFGPLPAGERLLALWEEYEAGATLEARLVKQLDRLEMALQAVIYQRHEGLETDEFLDSAAEVIDHPALRTLLDEMQE
jgi:putative hydrolases of HD superfamily